MAKRSGDIAAILIGKAKKGAGEPAQSPRVAACQAVLDAIKADDAGALDAALAQWDDAYDAEKPDEG